MKNHQKLTLLFWHRKSKADAKGNAPIICRISIEGEDSEEIAIGRKVHVNNWDIENKKAKGGSLEKATNQKINEISVDLRVLPIVENVGNLLSKGKHTKTSQLYQYLNNEINVYSLEKVSSVVMQNFVAFVFNPDSIEKLENFTETKSIEERWMSFAFWCAYNGFANTSKNFVKPIFESGNRDLQRSIDFHLRNLFSNIHRFSITLPQEQLSPPLKKLYLHLLTKLL